MECELGPGRSSESWDLLSWKFTQNSIYRSSFPAPVRIKLSCNWREKIRSRGSQSAEFEGPRISNFDPTLEPGRYVSWVRVLRSEPGSEPTQTL